MIHRTASIREQVKAARAGYLLPAALIALWAALIPYLRDRLNLDSAGVAQLVFAFGAGSIAGMLAASPLTKYFGSRLTCFASVLGAATGIVVISLSSVFLLTVIFACFFALCAGCLEVGINIYGASLERQFKLRLMIPLHAYYSAGEVTGAACCLLLLNFNLPPFLVICALSLICLALALFYFPSIVNFNFRARKEQSFMLPTRQVSCLCLIVLITYMTGGAMVDWSGIYLADHSCLDLRQAVIGYTLVSVAMMLCRMFGNFLQDKIGTLRLLRFAAVKPASRAYLDAARLCINWLRHVQHYTAVLCSSSKTKGYAITACCKCHVCSRLWWITRRSCPTGGCSLLYLSCWGVRAAFCAVLHFTSLHNQGKKLL